MKGIAIVGAGLFGSIAAALAHRKGFAVTLIDRGEPLAGSGPAACLMKPGWFSGIAADDVKEGLCLLDALYGIKNLSFSLNGLTRTDVHWVDPKAILGAPSCVGAYRVTGDVVERHAQHLVVDVKGTRIVVGFDHCLLAGGVWAGELADVPPIKALAGAAFTHDLPCPEPFIRVWAPYKQLVGFERETGKTWVGDGSAILHKNWTPDRVEQSRKRAQDAIGLKCLGLRFEKQEGLRPYVEGHKAGYFAKVGERTWVSTGGAKNGTIIAAIQAKKFVDAITHLG